MHDSLEAKFERLRRLLLEAKELSEVSDYFVGELVDDRRFMLAGTRRDDAVLRRVIQGAMNACFGEVPLAQAQLIHLPGYDFWHGAAALGVGGIVLVLYCERTDVGLLSVARSFADGVVHYIRFSVSAAASGGGEWGKARPGPPN